MGYPVICLRIFHYNYLKYRKKKYIYVNIYTSVCIPNIPINELTNQLTKLLYWCTSISGNNRQKYLKNYNKNKIVQCCEKVKIYYTVVKSFFNFKKINISFNTQIEEHNRNCNVIEKKNYSKKKYDFDGTMYFWVVFLPTKKWNLPPQKWKKLTGIPSELK